ALSGGWLRGLAYGYTEGLAVALLLWAILSHMDGRRGRALVLAFLISLSRPEAWAFLLPYAAFVAWKEPRLRLPAAAVAIGSPLLWILPDWWGSGQLFHASRVAGVNLSADGANPGLHVVRAGLGLISLPLELLAVGALAWILLLGVATEAHYPGAGRFLVPPVAIVCVLAGVGAAWLSQLAGRVAPQAALAVLLAAAVLPVLARADASADQA